jgi:hypothetical protein
MCIRATRTSSMDTTTLDVDCYKNMLILTLTRDGVIHDLHHYFKKWIIHNFLKRITFLFLKTGKSTLNSKETQPSIDFKVK